MIWFKLGVQPVISDGNGVIVSYGSMASTVVSPSVWPNGVDYWDIVKYSGMALIVVLLSVVKVAYHKRFYDRRRYPRLISDNHRLR